MAPQSSQAILTMKCEQDAIKIPNSNQATDHKHSIVGTTTTQLLHIHMYIPG
jgi:hypothetical protein